jgi:tRNA-splicing ligase RtcB (3'-phosphate/5'-hydroxy nucleic acid ligase)
MSKLPFIHKHIAVMPDVHWGMGSTVGSVDLGCSMMAYRLSLTAKDLPDNLAPLRSEIESRIPHGRTNDGKRGDRGAWGQPSSRITEAFDALRLDERLERVMAKHPKMFALHTLEAGLTQLGTLGTGNHFVEICLDLDQNVWIMLHSGSRGIGNRIGSYFIQRAKELCERWHVVLPDNDLAYLPEGDPIFKDYMDAISWAQDYARRNRELMMMRSALNAVAEVLDRGIDVNELAINCHHVATENHFGSNVYVTRKGAVRARAGDLGIIPGSMGARSFIVRGKGNPESFCSCSHGAGRSMSRGEARKRFTSADLAAQTQGVECRKDADVIDEIPGAYKDIQTVMDNQSDLVEIIAELKQVVCVKG